MSSHSHRFAGWPHLNPVEVCLFALALLAATSSVSARQDEAVEDSIFLAPFVNVTFLRQIEIRLLELQILRERSTGIYFDKKTSLVWSTQDNGRDIDWRRAQDYCTELEWAGFDDWRMPTLAELERLMEPISKGLYSTPDPIRLTACCVWSSTRKDDVAAWNFNYRYSKRFVGSMTHTYDLRALCLRTWSEEDGWHPDDEEITAAIPK